MVIENRITRIEKNDSRSFNRLISDSCGIREAGFEALA
jgi:hypothetical protein